MDAEAKTCLSQSITACISIPIWLNSYTFRCLDRRFSGGFRDGQIRWRSGCWSGIDGSIQRTGGTVREVFVWPADDNGFRFPAVVSRGMERHGGVPQERRFWFVFS